jgi:transposase
VRGRAITEDELHVAAMNYREARHDRRPATAAVAAACGISPSTAGKWIMRAREAGMLQGVPDRHTTRKPCPTCGSLVSAKEPS